MILYYDVEEHTWFHTLTQKTYTFGIEEVPLLFKEKPSPSSIPFSVFLQKRQNAGPLVGILAGRKNKKSVVGNGTLFKKIQEQIIDNGGVSFVFTPEDVRENGTIKGLLYLPHQNRWISIVSPFPHIVYNRLPFRKLEQEDEYKSVLRLFQEKKVCFFNPSFLDKYELYSIFKEHPRVGTFFPDTILIEDANSLKKFFEAHTSIYVKPTYSAKGNGIFKVQLEDNALIVVTNRKSKLTYGSFEDFWEDYKEKFREKNYIAQKEVSPLLYNGNRYDFRILAHYNGEKYVVTGIGIRQSVEQNITTHIPNGGKLIPYDEVSTERDDDFVREIVHECGEKLSESLGFFGEFSIDAGLTANKEYVIYEINSKPMSFDEPEIEDARLKNLIRLFHYLFT
jgi:hypothetical protein